MSKSKGRAFLVGREDRRSDYFFPREMTREPGTQFEPSLAPFGVRAWLADLITPWRGQDYEAQ